MIIGDPLNAVGDGLIDWNLFVVVVTKQLYNPVPGLWQRLNGFNDLLLEFVVGQPLVLYWGHEVYSRLPLAYERGVVSCGHHVQVKNEP